MADVPKPREVFISPYISLVTEDGTRVVFHKESKLTIQNSLAQSHHGRREHQQGRQRACLPVDIPLGEKSSGCRFCASSNSCFPAMREDKIEVIDIHKRFDDVQKALRGSEAIPFIVCLPTVDVVHLDI